MLKEILMSVPLQVKKYHGQTKTEINKTFCFRVNSKDNLKVNPIYCILLSILGHTNCYIIMYIHIEERNFVGFDRLTASCHSVGATQRPLACPSDKQGRAL